MIKKQRVMKNRIPTFDEFILQEKRSEEKKALKKFDEDIERITKEQQEETTK